MACSQREVTPTRRAPAWGGGAAGYTPGVSRAAQGDHSHEVTASEPRNYERRARQPRGSEKRLLRSREQRVITGLCGGIGEYIGAEPRKVRWVFALTLILTLGTVSVAYLMLSALIGSAARPATTPA